MRVYGLDSSFNKIKEFAYVELTWNRKYYATGDYTLYIPASEATDVTYIQVEGRDEIGFLYKTTLQDTIEGVFLTLEGKFSEDLANDRATYMGKNILATDDLGDSLTALLTPLGITRGTGILRAQEATVAGHLQCGDEISRILKLENETFRIRRVDGAWKINFLTPRTISLQISRRIGNAAKVEYSRDISNYYHICKGYIEIPQDVVVEGYTGTVKIGGKWYETSSYTSTLSVDSRLQKRTLSREYSCPDELECVAANKQKIKNAITNLCKLELADHYIEQLVDVETLQKAGCQYLVDYDLGDILTIYIEELDVTFSAQIVEVQETWAKNKQEYKLVLDNKTVV